MDKIEIFTLGGSDRERRTLNTVISQSLTEKGYSNVRMLDDQGQLEAPVENVPSVLQAKAEYDPSLMRKEINVWSMPCSITNMEQASAKMDSMSEVVDNFEGGTFAVGGSGTDEDEAFRVTAIVVLQEGPKLRHERKLIEATAKEVAEAALQRADKAVRRQTLGLHVVKPDDNEKEQ
jgi:hypothetical protein